MINIGATYLGQERCHFRVWTPEIDRVELHLWAADAAGSAEPERLIPMQRQGQGYHQATVDNVKPGSRYLYRLNGGEEWPDPVSRFQPEGVHHPSAVVDPHFDWQDQAWPGLPLPEFVIYELHIGTFTEEGIFDAIIPHLERLRELGITALELMVDACHQRGLAVILDVVYNHLGPEGAYLAKYGPCFTEQYRTGWGTAVNLDGPYSDEVRNFFIQNALYWITEFHAEFRLIFPTWRPRPKR